MMKKDFEERLLPILPDLVAKFGTPFHIYDERGIIENGERLKAAFREFPGFQEFFAVKACPNPTILNLMANRGFGFDCSSLPEIFLVDMGFSGREIMFTSNNTSRKELAAVSGKENCLLNLDDIALIDKVPAPFPELICFRYNPGKRREGNSIIGQPEAAKYGLRDDQLVRAYAKALAKGAKRFGLHTMVCSNQLDYRYFVETVAMILEQAEILHVQLGIAVEFVNIGGGIGIPYLPDNQEFDLSSLAAETRKLFDAFSRHHGFEPRLFMESGRYMTGPYGVLVTSVQNRMSKYREYVGVDASMSALMRPALYGAYHHISVLGGEGRPTEVVDVVGSLCENNDKFAIGRELPRTEEGDILIIHDSGAHGYAMGFNYNGRLRPQELLLQSDGQVSLIRRAEYLGDYLSVLTSTDPRTITPIPRKG